MQGSGQPTSSLINSADGNSSASTGGSGSGGNTSQSSVMGGGQSQGQGYASSSGMVIEGPDARYGLMGLLSVIRVTDPDLSMLHLGCDLTSLGLSLNSTE